MEAFTWNRMYVILAVSSNKDLDGVVAALAPIADVWFAARNDSVPELPPSTSRNASPRPEAGSPTWVAWRKGSRGPAMRPSPTTSSS